MLMLNCALDLVIRDFSAFEVACDCVEVFADFSFHCEVLSLTIPVIEIAIPRLDDQHLEHINR